jgi:amino acid permease
MKTLSLFSFAVNQTVGVGMLGIPYAFQQSGIFFSLLALAFCSLTSYYIGTLAVELIFKDSDISQPLKGKKSKFYVQLIDQKNSTFLIILFIFFGVGIILAYSLIFSSSFSINIPLPYLSSCDIYNPLHTWCLTNYRIYLTIFTIIIYIFAIRGIQSQKWLQITITFLCSLVILLLILIALYRILTNEPTASLVLINYENISLGFAMLVFSVTFQHSLPSLVEVCEDSILKIPKLICVTVFMSYSILGVVVAYAFPNVGQQCNLNYSYLDGWFGEGLKMIIIVFPALNVVASAPVVIIMITDNVMCLYGEASEKVIIIMKSGIVIFSYLVAFFIQDLV